jgi:mannose-6-phosphate isomerase-like protein (cupin superfamily)
MDLNDKIQDFGRKKVWAISKDDLRGVELETEDQQTSFMSDQLNYFLNTKMKEEYPKTIGMEETENTQVLDLDDNLSVAKSKVISEKVTESQQDEFLEEQLENFLGSELNDILKTSLSTEPTSLIHQERKVPPEILDMYNIVNDAEINITEEDILNFLQIEYRWPYVYYHDMESPRPNNPDVFGFDCPVQCLTHKGRVNYSEFYNKDGKFIYDEWKKLYDLGFTFMLCDVMDLTPELRDLRKKLRDYTGRTISGNFYLTNGESKNHRSNVSWPPHDHHYSVAVKVIYGSTKWIIGSDEKDFSAGETILIPSETTHTVVECTEKRLSLTVNLF